MNDFILNFANLNLCISQFIDHCLLLIIIYIWNWMKHNQRILFKLKPTCFIITRLILTYFIAVCCTIDRTIFTQYMTITFIDFGNITQQLSQLRLQSCYKWPKVDKTDVTHFIIHLHDVLNVWFTCWLLLSLHYASICIQRYVLDWHVYTHDFDFVLGQVVQHDESVCWGFGNIFELIAVHVVPVDVGDVEVEVRDRVRFGFERLICVQEPELRVVDGETRGVFIKV